MSKTTFFAKIKLFISSHLVPVIATSSILVLGISAGVVAIIINNQPKQEAPEASDNSQEISKEEKEPENSDNTEEKSEDNSSEQDKPNNSANTAQNQNNTSSQTNPTKQPSSSGSSSNNANLNSPATPNKPSTPTQPTTPVEPAKTEYFYVCKGTIPDPATKAQMLAEFPEAKDYITLTLNGPRKVTNCWDEFKNSSMVDPNYTKYFTWQLIECNSFEEMNSYLN